MFPRVYSGKSKSKIHLQTFLGTKSNRDETVGGLRSGPPNISPALLNFIYIPSTASHMETIRDHPQSGLVHRAPLMLKREVNNFINVKAKHGRTFWANTADIPSFPARTNTLGLRLHASMTTSVTLCSYACMHAVRMYVRFYCHLTRTYTYNAIATLKPKRTFSMSLSAAFLGTHKHAEPIHPFPRVIYAELIMALERVAGV